MDARPVSRREFLGDTVKVAAGVAACLGAAGAPGPASAAAATAGSARPT